MFPNGVTHLCFPAFNRGRFVFFFSLCFSR